jgi:MerR family copper efflux transcriptional regulator
VHAAGGFSNTKMLDSCLVRITEAAQRLGTSARMLRYRDLLGLLPPVREPGPGRPVTATALPTDRVRATRAAAGAGAARPAPRHRRFTEDDLAAVALALGIEQRHDISPAALAFGLRVMTEPAVRADVAELGRRVGRIPPLPARALEFEKERALRLLSLAPASLPGQGQSAGRRAARIAGSVVSARDDSYRSGSR